MAPSSVSTPAAKGNGNKTNQPKPISRAYEDAYMNEQVLRFVLLFDILKSAGFCESDIAIALSKYVKTLSRASLDMLQIHLPLARYVADDALGFTATLAGIAGLSATGKANQIGLPVIAFAIEKARSKLVSHPEWFMGQEGWFLWAAYGLTRTHVPAKFNNKGDKVVAEAHVENQFHLAELERALWVAHVARLRIMLPEVDFNRIISGSNFKSVYRASLWDLFRIGTSRCACEDQDEIVYSSEDKYSMRDKKQLALVEKKLAGYIKAFGVDADCSKPLDIPTLFNEDLQWPSFVYKSVLEMHWENPVFVKLAGDLKYKKLNGTGLAKARCNEAFALMNKWRVFKGFKALPARR